MDMKDRMWKWIDILYLCRVWLIEINIKVDEYKIFVCFYILFFMFIFGLECSNNMWFIDDKIYFYCILFLWSLYEIIFVMKIEVFLKKFKIIYIFGINFVCL